MRQNRAFRKRPANSPVRRSGSPPLTQYLPSPSSKGQNRGQSASLEVATIVRLIVQTFIWFGAMGILLFLAAGTFAWLVAWAYLVLMAALSVTLGIDPPRTIRGCFGSAWAHHCSAINRPPTKCS